MSVEPKHGGSGTHSAREFCIPKLLTLMQQGSFGLQNLQQQALRHNPMLQQTSSTLVQPFASQGHDKFAVACGTISIDEHDLWPQIPAPGKL